MLSSGAVLTLALALIAAQGSRSGAATKRKKAAPAPPAATIEKRVAPPARTEGGQPGQVGQTGQAHKRGESAPAGATNGEPGESRSSGTEGQATTKSAKTKVYTFGAMDVEGKLKTPQLLYFLNRVKLELEMSAPDHRSFMKELAKTADDPNL